MTKATNIKPKVILVDDHQSAINDLTDSLVDFEVVGVAMDGKEFEELIAKDISFDLAVLDMLIPRSNESDQRAYSLIDSIPKMLELHPGVQILVHSQTVPIGYLSALLDVGVGGFVHKGDRYKREDMNQAALSVYNRKGHFSQRIMPLLHRKDRLVDTHLKLLQYYQQNPSATYTHAAEEFCVSVSTIKHRLSEINHILGTENRAEAVLTALQKNYIANLNL